MSNSVHHIPEESRFEITFQGKISYLDYHLSGGVITFIHAYTPPEIRGKGIAAEVAKYALDYSRDNNLKVIPQCPYIRDYIDKHKDYQGFLA